jgi:hypothetical protein
VWTVSGFCGRNTRGQHLSLRQMTVAAVAAVSADADPRRRACLSMSGRASLNTIGQWAAVELLDRCSIGICRNQCCRMRATARFPVSKWTLQKLGEKQNSASPAVLQIQDGAGARSMNIWLPCSSYAGAFVSGRPHNSNRALSRCPHPYGPRARGSRRVLAQGRAGALRDVNSRSDASITRLRSLTEPTDSR